MHLWKEFFEIFKEFFYKEKETKNSSYKTLPVNTIRLSKEERMERQCNNTSNNYSMRIKDSLAPQEAILKR